LDALGADGMLTDASDGFKEELYDLVPPNWHLDVIRVFDAVANDILAGLPVGGWVELVRKFLDVLGVDRILAAASADFKAKLCAKQPTNPAAWLTNKDADEIAAVITEKAGKAKAAAIRESLPASDLAESKQPVRRRGIGRGGPPGAKFPTINTEKGADGAYGLPMADEAPGDEPGESGGSVRADPPST
jgi:hypothetical protein